MTSTRALCGAAYVAMLSFSDAAAAEIYVGEPLGEALHDLIGVTTLIAHELCAASPLLRTDVFRLADKRLLAVTSKANKVGEPYSIIALRVTAPGHSPLTKKLPTVSAVQLTGE